MAENVVLAQLSIDETGAVRAVTNLDVAQRALQASTNETATAFRNAKTPASEFENVGGVMERRLLSLRHAAIALFGSFTLAGAILEFKALVMGAAEMDSGFARLTASGEVFKHTLETVISQAFGMHTGIKTLTDDIILLSAATDNLMSARGGFALLESISVALMGLSMGFNVDQIKTLVKGIYDITGATDQFQKSLEKIRGEVGAQEVQDFLGLPTPQEIQRIVSGVSAALGVLSRAFLSGRESLTLFSSQFEKMLQELDKIGKGQGPLASKVIVDFDLAVQQAFEHGAIAASQFIAAEDRIIKRFIAMGDTAGAIIQADVAMDRLYAGFSQGKVRADQLWGAYERFRQQLLDSGATNKAIANFDRLNEHLIRTHDLAVALKEGMDLAASSIGDSLSKALFEGGITLKQAIAIMLRDLARLYIVKSLESLATGILASTPWGQMLGLGPPHPYFIAAEIYGALAGMASAAAIIVGGRGNLSGSSGGSQGTASGTTAAVSAAPQRPTVLVQVDTLIGEAAWVRRLIDQIQQQLRFGAAGGTF